MGHAYGTINALSIAGRRADDSRWVMFAFFGGGHGGNAEGDGLSHGNPADRDPPSSRRSR